MSPRLRNRPAGIFAVIVLGACIASSMLIAARAASDGDYKKLPGYVDFGPVLGDMQASVEVFLKGSLLVLAREAVKTDDPELAELLSKIDYIHVKVLPLQGISAVGLESKTSRFAEQLEKKGWELTVRMREDEEQVHVYVLPGDKGDIAGLVVMAIEEGDEAAFVNVVGNINPTEIGRIGRTFHIDAMDAPIEVEIKGDAKMTVKGGDKANKETD